jgi:hypothetical protein
MEKRIRENLGTDISLPQPSPSDLRGRQSVRATFKLSERAIDALSILAIHLGIKQKSLFDHLMDDIRSLNAVAREIQRHNFDNLARVQKTYVLSRRTLTCLEEASKNFDIPRDALVEYSIQRLAPIIAEERERHLKRKEVLREITDYLNKGEQLLRKSKRILGDEDPVYGKFETAMSVLNNAHSIIESFVKKGKIIEDY